MNLFLTDTTGVGHALIDAFYTGHADRQDIRDAAGLMRGRDTPPLSAALLAQLAAVPQTDALLRCLDRHRGQATAAQLARCADLSVEQTAGGLAALRDLQLVTDDWWGSEDTATWVITPIGLVAFWDQPTHLFA